MQGSAGTITQGVQKGVAEKSGDQETPDPALALPQRSCVCEGISLATWALPSHLMNERAAVIQPFSSLSGVLESCQSHEILLPTLLRKMHM